MGYTIFITEKPSVAQTYRQVLKVHPQDKTDGYIEGFSPVLNKNVRITWAVGHLIGLASVPEQLEHKFLSATEQKEHKWKKSDLPILPKDFLYKTKQETIKQFSVIKSLYTSPDIDAIYYAGDSGREGIYIQALIRNQIFGGADPAFPEYVVWISSQTDEEILRGIQTAKRYHSYDNMIYSGYERAITDWMIGMNFTQGLTLSCGKLVVVGRVMTPTLAMIVKRQQEIDNFKVEDYYGINATTTSGVAKWKADKDSRYFESNLLFNENGFTKKQDAEALLSELAAAPSLLIEDVKVTEKKESAPLLYNLTDLQALCAKTLHITPSQTLSIAQSLYEKKLITYPRTDARVLSSAVAKEIEEKLGKHVPPKYVDDSKITDHYALIPTFQDPKDLSSNEQYVFDEIVTRFYAIFEPPYVYDAISVTYRHSNGEHFYESIKNVKQLGWKAFYNEAAIAPPVPIPQKGAQITAAFSLNAMQTTPPSAYTTGSITKAMENAGKLVEDEALREQIKSCGIGTTATRANIIDKLIQKGYITVDKKQKIAPTELGKAIIPVVAQFDEQLISPEKTADMEQQLSNIVDGTQSKEEHRKAIESYISKTVEKINTTNGISLAGVAGQQTRETHNCPCCNKPLKYGKFGWYCECGFNFSLQVCGHKMQEKDLVALIDRGRTSTYTFTSKAGKKFKSYLTVDPETHKTKFNFD